MIKDPHYDVLTVIQDSFHIFGVDATIHIRNLSISNYLKMIRIPDIYDEAVELLSTYYNDRLENFVEAVQSGSFISNPVQFIDEELRSAIHLSMKYVNLVFSLNSYLKSNG